MSWITRMKGGEWSPVNIPCTALEYLRALTSSETRREHCPFLLDANVLPPNYPFLCHVGWQRCRPVQQQMAWRLALEEKETAVVVWRPCSCARSHILLCPVWENISWAMSRACWKGGWQMKRNCNRNFRKVQAKFLWLLFIYYLLNACVLYTA